MKKILIFFTLLAANDLLYAQEKKKRITADHDSVESQVKADAINKVFGNLPIADRIKYKELLVEAYRLYSKDRLFETLLVLCDMRMIFKKDPNALALEGWVSLRLRNFGLANDLFKKTLEIRGETPEILFNLAETEFCQNQWTTFLESSNYILDRLDSVEKKLNEEELNKKEGSKLSKFKHLDTQYSQLILFKQMLSYLALSKVESRSEQQRVEAKKKAMELAQEYSFMDDSPYYYYAEAALEFYQGNEKQATQLLFQAKRVFGINSPAILPWDDALMEFGYVDSHYGKSFKDSYSIEVPSSITDQIE